MDMEGLPEVIPPSGRVPRQRLLAAPILKRRRRRYREEIGKKTSVFRVSSMGVIYKRRGQQGGHQGSRRPLALPRPRARQEGA